jgi:hypothetical protein
VDLVRTKGSGTIADSHTLPSGSDPLRPRLGALPTLVQGIAAASCWHEPSERERVAAKRGPLGTPPWTPKLEGVDPAVPAHHDRFVERGIGVESWLPGPWMERILPPVRSLVPSCHG